MYNGIGLQTARGSSTSGHVMANKSHVLGSVVAKRVDNNRNQGMHNLERQNELREGLKTANAEIMDHKRKREIESKLFELKESLLEQGFSEERAEEEVERRRQDLTKGPDNAAPAASVSGSRSSTGGRGVTDSHSQIAL